MSFSCSNCERQTKYSCITCGKSVCVRSECSIPEVNEEAIGWQPNKRVGYCLKCALCTEKLVKDCQSEVDDKDHGQRDLTTCIREEEEEEESALIEEGEMVSSECRKRKKRIGRRATWKEDFEKTTPTHVFALLSKLCKSKATGLDNISAKLLRECPDVLAESLTHLFNQSIMTGIFPD